MEEKEREKKREKEKQRRTDKIEVAWETGSWDRKAILQPLKRLEVHMKFIKCSAHFPNSFLLAF